MSRTFAVEPYSDIATMLLKIVENKEIDLKTRLSCAHSYACLYGGSMLAFDTLLIAELKRSLYE